MEAPAATSLDPPAAALPSEAQPEVPNAPAAAGTQPMAAPPSAAALPGAQPLPKDGGKVPAEPEAKTSPPVSIDGVRSLGKERGTSVLQASAADASSQTTQEPATRSASSEGEKPLEEGKGQGASAPDSSAPEPSAAEEPSKAAQEPAVKSAQAEAVVAREAVLTIQGSAAVASSRSKETETPAAEVSEAESDLAKSNSRRRSAIEAPAASFPGLGLLSRGLSSLQQNTAAAAAAASKRAQELSSAAASGKNAERLEELQARVSESSKDVLRGAEKLQENARAALSSLWASRSSDGTSPAAASSLPSSSPAAASASARTGSASASSPGGEPATGAMAAVGAGMQQFWRQMSGNEASRALPRKQTPAQTARGDLAPGATPAASGSREGEGPEAASSAEETGGPGPHSTAEAAAGREEQDEDTGKAEGEAGSDAKGDESGTKEGAVSEGDSGAAAGKGVVSKAGEAAKPKSTQAPFLPPGATAAATAAASAAAAQAAAASEAAGAAAAAAASAAAHQASAAREAAEKAASAAAAAAAQQAAVAREAAQQAATTAKEAITSLTAKLVDESKIAAKGLQTRARHMASQNKRRFQNGDFDLDLTYITDTIIAMGFPAGDAASGLMGLMEGLYRNHVEDVQRMLETYHKGHYMVYNLCSEKLYDPAIFGGKAQSFAFEDGSVPPFPLIMDFCTHAQEWLSASKAEGGTDNVIAVHCKAGLGRTGLMISCLLLYLKFYTSAEDAVNFFSAKRCVSGAAITVPSQRRYVRYFEAIMRPEAPKLPVPKKYFLRGIRLHKCPFWLRPAVVVADHKGILFSSRRHPKTKDLLPNDLWFPSKQRKSVMVFAVPGERGFAELCGDFQLCFLDRNGDFHCWLNTTFLESRTFLGIQDFDNFEKRRAPCPGLVVEIVLIDEAGAMLPSAKPGDGAQGPSSTDPGRPPVSISNAPAAAGAGAKGGGQTAAGSLFARLTAGAGLQSLMGGTSGAQAPSGSSVGRGTGGASSGVGGMAGGGLPLGKTPSREEELHPDIFSDSDDEEEQKARRRAEQAAAAAGDHGAAGVPGDVASLGIFPRGPYAPAPVPGTPAAGLGVFTEALGSSMRGVGSVGGRIGSNISAAVSPHLGSKDTPGTPAAALDLFTGALSSSMKDMGAVGGQIGSSFKSVVASYRGSPTQGPASPPPAATPPLLQSDAKQGTAPALVPGQATAAAAAAGDTRSDAAVAGEAGGSASAGREKKKATEGSSAMAQSRVAEGDPSSGESGAGPSFVETGASTQAASSSTVTAVESTSATSATRSVAGAVGEAAAEPTPVSDTSTPLLGSSAAMAAGEASSALHVEASYMGPSADFAAVAAASSADPSMFTFGDLDDEDLEDFE